MPKGGVNPVRAAEWSGEEMKTLLSKAGERKQQQQQQQKTQQNRLRKTEIYRPNEWKVVSGWKWKA